MEPNKPSLFELRQYLKGLGFYDGSLNTNEMYDLYNALELSKNTASQDDEYRNRMVETEINCNMPESLQESGVLVENGVAGCSPNTVDPLACNIDDFELDFDNTVESIAKITPKGRKNSPKTLPKETENINISFNHVDTYYPLLTTYKPLCKIETRKIYNFPFYCRPEILALNYSERERAIGEFHRNLLIDLKSSQKQSIFYAPWGKSIHAKNNYNGLVDRQIETPINEIECSDEDENTEDDFEMYTSRSGRQTKRKLYTDDLVETDSNEKLQIPNPGFPKKRPGLSTFKNEESIKRSKINSETSSRTEKMFDNLLEDESKKVEKDKEMDAFEKTLVRFSEDEHLDNDIVEISVEEPFKCRRIEPPLHRKKNTKTKSSVRGGRGGTKKPNEKPSTSSEGGSQIYEPLPSTTTSSDNKIMKGVCPLCNEQFFQDELENHASTCCETVVISSNITTRKRATVSQLITCEACDEVLTLTTDYEVHVKECIERIKKK